MSMGFYENLAKTAQSWKIHQTRPRDSGDIPGTEQKSVCGPLLVLRRFQDRQSYVPLQHLHGATPFAHHSACPATPCHNHEAELNHPGQLYSTHSHPRSILSLYFRCEQLYLTPAHH